MIRRPPTSTRTDTLFPYTTLFRSEEAVLAAGGVGLLAEELQLEGAGHAHAVLVHREALVALRRRERAIGEQVVLVGREHQAPTEHGEEGLLPAGDGVDDVAGLVDRVGAHPALAVELADDAGNDAERGERGDAGEQTGREHTWNHVT